MDMQVVAHELRRWEPFVQSFKAYDWMKFRCSYDTEDVWQECRLRAAQALARVRALKPHLKGTTDEIRIVNRAIARAFLRMVRTANTAKRMLDPTATYTIQSGASWVPTSQQSLEQDYLDAEYQAAVERMCEQIRSIIGDDAYGEVLSAADGERAAGIPRAEQIRAYNRRRTAIQTVRRHFAGQEPPRSIRRSKQMDKTAASLGDDDLARTALVYKDTHGAKVVSLDRKHLTAHVEAVNSANGETYPFPPCFAEPAQYDPKDSSCGVECDFRRECAACIPAYRDPQIEAQLTQLKGAVAPVSKPKAPKPAAPQPEPVQATEPAKAAAPPAPPKVKKEKPPKPPPVGTIEEEAPKLLAEAIALRAPKLPKPKPPRKPRALPARIGPYSARIGPVTLSKRKGVEAPKYFRLPQGSAVALANLPVGTEKTRDYEGIRYTVVKVEDGKTHKTKGGMKRKLDGRWKITGKAKIQKDGSAKPFASVPDMVATLGRITRFITGKAWSAARFWSILPPLLDPKSPEFNPAAFKPVLIYAYGAGEEKPKGKAKKKAKPKKAPKKAKASSKKKAA